MTIITADISRAFIREVKLAGAQRPLRARALSNKPIELRSNDAQSLVVGSGLVVAAENVPVETREDLINCTLFAQLAASGAVGDPTDISRWYDAYFRTLSVLGWRKATPSSRTTSSAARTPRLTRRSRRCLRSCSDRRRRRSWS
jgi:hypothetical protein